MHEQVKLYSETTNHQGKLEKYYCVRVSMIREILAYLYAILIVGILESSASFMIRYTNDLQTIVGRGKNLEQQNQVERNRCSLTTSYRLRDTHTSSKMLLPQDMMAAQSKMLYQMNKYYGERVQARMGQVQKTIREVCKVVQEVLKEVEVQEPRFISSLTECNGRYEGLEVISPGEFEVVLYLNQMGVFNFVDDGSLPGCAVLKLSDGRKRSMSLWTLVAQACDKCAYRDSVKMIADTTEVKLRIRERYVVQITPAFKCAGLWPRSASHWPIAHIPWPHPNIVAEVKTEGFDMLSKECIGLQGKQSAMEGDAWALSFIDAENRLLQGGSRKRCLSILKTLRDRHLDLPGNPVTSYHMKTLLLYECEKHPHEAEWDEICIADRINGILLQLISCLQCRRCPHYFLPNLDLFKGKSPSGLENAAKQVWRLTRELLTNSRALEKL
ncbi:Protein mab-21 [Melipona quadrifasciata]|uniref:Protein mab-21 n=1 Tax=Melipona quadrifasciata TaxID=166423 RepID=A0A0M9A4D1_9HYME|nr:Protein mab-21 [Melipona quadrifasciata]